MKSELIALLSTIIVFLLICLLPSTSVPAIIVIRYRMWRLNRWIKKNPDGTTYDKECYKRVKKLYISVDRSGFRLSKYDHIGQNLKLIANNSGISLDVKVSFLKEMISKPLTSEEIQKNNVGIILGRNEHAN